MFALRASDCFSPLTLSFFTSPGSPLEPEPSSTADLQGEGEYSDNDSDEVSRDEAHAAANEVIGAAFRTAEGGGHAGSAREMEEGEMSGRQPVQESEDKEQQVPFRQRPRSDTKQLPLSVRESFRSLKEELWGEAGVHRATRLHVRSSWQEKVLYDSMRSVDEKEGPCLIASQYLVSPHSLQNNMPLFASAKFCSAQL